MAEEPDVFQKSTQTHTNRTGNGRGSLRTEKYDLTHETAKQGDVSVAVAYDPKSPSQKTYTVKVGDIDSRTEVVDSTGVSAAGFSINNQAFMDTALKGKVEAIKAGFDQFLAKASAPDSDGVARLTKEEANQIKDMVQSAQKELMPPENKKLDSRQTQNRTPGR